MDNSEDYVSAHLKWIIDNPKFIPHGGVNPEIAPTYLKYMEWFYFRNDIVTPEQRNMHGYFFYKCDKAHKLKTELALKRLEKDSVTPSEYFVTIGFNHQTWTIDACVNIIKTILGFDWVLSSRAVFELHRENGEHPHCHFVIKTDEKMPRSKVLEKIWAAKGIKKVCLKKSFVDVKPLLEHHHKYILGFKQESKMPYVAKDIEWRQKNNIEDLFLKN